MIPMKKLPRYGLIPITNRSQTESPIPVINEIKTEAMTFRVLVIEFSDNGSGLADVPAFAFP